jgi:hypothetical protein
MPKFGAVIVYKEPLELTESSVLEELIAIIFRVELINITAMDSFRTFMPFYQTSRFHFPEDRNPSRPFSS